MTPAQVAVKETRFHSEPPALTVQQESTTYLTVLRWYIRLGCCCVGLRYGIFFGFYHFFNWLLLIWGARVVR